MDKKSCDTCKHNGTGFIGCGDCDSHWSSWEPKGTETTDDQFRLTVEAIATELVDLLCRKQQDYGPGNIAAFGERGVIVRMNDKMERLKRLVWESKAPANEAVEDSYKDLANYSLIALMVRRGVWPQ